MKKVLDLLEEYCKLNDARVDSRGSLPPHSERRWKELKEFYDQLMSRRPPRGRPVTNRDLAADIRERLQHRDRLRVRSEMDVFFRYRDSYLPSRVINVSRGGLFLSSNILLSKGSRITLYLPNLGGDFGELFETKGEVAWSTKGMPQSGLPRGMGIRFYGMKGNAAEQLDAFIVESLQERLMAADAEATRRQKGHSAPKPRPGRRHERC